MIFSVKIRSAVLVFSAAAVLLSCRAVPVSSGAGKISEGTLRYLYSLSPRKVSPEEFIDEIKTKEAKGVLASKLGLRDDPHYKKFLLLSRRTRESRGAGVILKEVYRKAVPENALEGLLNFSSRISDAAGEIMRLRRVKGNIVFLEKNNILIGQYEGKKLYLHDLRHLLLREEWRQIAELQTSPLKKALKENIRLFLKSRLSSRLMERMKADYGEAARFDHNEVADLFLSRRYGLASEGIYPVTTFKLPLKPPELLEHFARMRTWWNPIESVEARATVVRDLETAKEFVAALEKKGEFAALARHYGREKKYISTAEYHTVKGIAGDESLKAGEGFGTIRRLIIETARQNSYKPEIFRIFRGYAIVQIRKINLVKGEFRYNDYRDFVEISLTRKLLAKQFPLDIKDTAEKINFRVKMPLVKSVIKVSAVK